MHEAGVSEESYKDWKTDVLRRVSLVQKTSDRYVTELTRILYAKIKVMSCSIVEPQIGLACIRP